MPRKRGRPKGSTKGPDALMRDEIRATASTMSHIRTMVEKQLVEIERQLAHPDVTLEVRLTTLKTISELLKPLNETVASAAKLVFSGKSPVEPETEASIEDIITGLTKGEK